MKLFDYSKRFSRAAAAWMKQNAGKYPEEELEAKLPDLYMRWLDTPAAWLDGAKPSEYFLRFDDPAQLIQMLGEYCAANVPAPDPLLDRIASLGEAACAPLTGVLTDPAAPERQRELAGSLLVEIGSALPVEECVALIAAPETPEPVREQAMAILRGAGGDAEKPMLTAMEAADPAARCAYLDALLDCSRDGRLYDWALYGLHNDPERREAYVSYLLRLGDERAIEPLTRMLSMADVGYVAFQEIRNAIESLGGEVTLEREFAGDRDYEQLRLRDAEEEPAKGE